MRPARMAAAIGIAALLPGLATGAPARVSFRGCPVSGAEHGCVLVRSGGQTFNLAAAKPPIRFSGFGVRGTGVPGGMSICMQGTALTDIRYTYTRQRCASARRAREAGR